MLFHYRQRVRCVSPPDGNASIVGRIGTVYHDGEDGTNDRWIAVEFDSSFPLGHCIPDQLNSGELRGFNSTGWCCEPETLVPVEESININELI